LDLAKLRTDSKEGAVHKVINPHTLQPDTDSKGGPVTITLASPDSEYGRKAQRKMRDAIMAKKGLTTPEEDIEADAELLANVTLAWTGIEFEGEFLTCTIENARRIYAIPGLRWLRGQLMTFFNDQRNFLPPSQTT
jgi:hypothetical protein